MGRTREYPIVKSPSKVRGRNHIRIYIAVKLKISAITATTAKDENESWWRETTRREKYEPVYPRHQANAKTAHGEHDRTSNFTRLEKLEHQILHRYGHRYSVENRKTKDTTYTLDTGAAIHHSPGSSTEDRDVQFDQ